MPNPTLHSRQAIFDYIVAYKRAKRLCILIGSRMAVQMAVQNNQVRRRHTALVSRLQAVSKEVEA